jgi:alpha-D-xyloside xylohydrolase
MPFEYPDDPACRYLDMQYMLGPSLLVAPIFNDQSTAQYYLPEGTWTDLFEGTVRKGGTWYTAKYDYFHLPLYVRENSMIPWGNNGELPDYDYTDHTVLRIYQPKPGAHTACTIPDLHGAPAAGIDMHVSEDGTAVTLDISGRLNAASYEIHTGEKVLTGTVGTGENIISIS